jgi:uncharacterized protein YfaS (alpha-2-macroglobulin family)
VGYQHTAERLSAYLFSDRGIYRPGDPMHIGMVVRAADWSKKLIGVPLELEVIDARGAVVKREKLKLSSAGFESVSHKTQDSSPTGTYTANLYLVRGTEQEVRRGEALPNALLGSTTVGSEFQPTISYRSNFRPNNRAMVSPGLKVRVNLQNLFERRRATGVPLVIVVTRLSRSRLSGIKSFYDPQRQNVADEDRQTKTDETGRDRSTSESLRQRHLP